MDWFPISLKALGDKLDWSTLVLLVVLLIHDRRLSSMTKEIGGMVKSVSTSLNAQKSANDLATARMTEIRDAILKVALAIMRRQRADEQEQRERDHGNASDFPRPVERAVHQSRAGRGNRGSDPHGGGTGEGG